MGLPKLVRYVVGVLVDIVLQGRLDRFVPHQELKSFLRLVAVFYWWWTGLCPAFSGGEPHLPFPYVPFPPLAIAVYCSIRFSLVLPGRHWASLSWKMLMQITLPLAAQLKQCV
jgi:hypothetical protein